MTISRRFLPALIFSLALQWGQQAGWVHLVSHLGGQSAHVHVAAPDDDDKEATDSLSHVCVTCLAVVGLDAGLVQNWHFPGPDGMILGRAGSPLLLQGESLTRSFLARAPPSFPEFA